VGVNRQTLGILGFLAMAAAVPAAADDQPFLTISTTDIQTEHGMEFEQTTGWKSGHANEAANEFFTRAEIEYGITDDLQIAGYLNYEFEEVHPHPLPSPLEKSSVLGVSGELIWRVMNPYFDPFGLAFYVEPSIAPNTRELEIKILAQKNFLNDTLRTALNINFEDVWERDSLGSWQKSSALEFNLGASYNVTPDFSVGVELGNERGFDGHILGTGAIPVSSSVFFGPTIQVIGHPWKVNVGFQTQLPWASDPSHTPGSVVHGRTADAEHFRAAFRLSRDV
jgi:hypothetical protein